MDRDSNIDNVFSREGLDRLIEAVRCSGYTFNEVRDNMDALLYALRSLRDPLYTQADIEIEPTPELDEFLSGFKVTTRQEVY